MSDDFEVAYSKDKHRLFDTGAKRDGNSNKAAVHNILGYTRLRFGYHMRMGANHYGDKNWLKGMPTESYLESVDRHLAEYRYALENNLPQKEDNLSAIIFGIQGCMINEQKEGVKPDHYFKKVNE